MATTHPEHLPYDIFRPDRPGWIPEWVGDDWDPNPYAYQTREELMPAGHTHNLYLITLAQMLAPHLQQQGRYIAVDVFVFYRDWEGRRQRIAPDALIAPTTELSEAQQLKSYDLDVEALPLCVVEVTSESSKASDWQRKRLFYASLGISEYLLIDILDDDNPELLKLQTDLYVWQLQDNPLVEAAPDQEGFLHLESIGVRIRADGQQLVAQVIATGEMLHTTTELREALAAEEQARREAEQRAVDEASARQRAEAELAQLRAELARLRANDQST